MKTFLFVLVALAVIAGGAFYFSRSEQTLGVHDPIQQGNRILPNPTDGAAASSTGGTLTPGTYYFKITSVDYAGGQTKPSAQFSGTASGNGGILVTLTPTTGAYSTRLWVATTSGAFYAYKTATSSTLVASTTTGLTQATIPSINSAYYFNSGVDEENTFLWAYATADTLVKSGPTYVHSITYSPTDAAATAGSIAILDATVAGDNATTTLYGVPGAAIPPQTIILDQIFTDGLYIDFTTTADVNVSVSYK